MKTLALFINKIDNSKKLIQYAALLGKDINAKIHVLYVQNPETYSTQLYMGVSGAAIAPDPALFQKIEDDVKEKVSGYIKEIEAKNHETHSIEFKSEPGDAAAILEEKVESKTYDMVMLQSDAGSDFWLQDSTIMGIVRNVPCPVWILPPDVTYKPMKKIVYATDYDEEDISTLKSLTGMMKPYDSDILALHISNSDKFEDKLKSEGFAELLKEKTGYDKISVKMIPDNDDEDAVEILVGEAEKVKADLIVALKDNNNFFERLFNSSFTADLIKKAQLPILVFQKTK